MTDMLADAAKAAATGAAAGSFIPGIGTAIGAVGGAVLAVANDAGVTRWLFGPNGDDTLKQVAQVAQQVTGTADPAGQDAALAADPDKAMALHLGLAKIAAERDQAQAQARLDAMRAVLADRANARAATGQLTAEHSLLAWGAAVISALVLVTFGFVMWVALTRSLPAGSEAILNMLLGTLGAMSMAVVSYWVGSSAGSVSKDSRLAASVPASLLPHPAAVVPAGTDH